MKRTRCWATADAGLRSHIRKYLRCRCGRSSKRRSTARSEGIKVFPEIMIPLILDRKELKILETATRRVADEIISRSLK